MKPMIVGDRVSSLGEDIVVEYVWRDIRGMEVGVKLVWRGCWGQWTSQRNNLKIRVCMPPAFESSEPIVLFEDCQCNESDLL